MSSLVLAVLPNIPSFCETTCVLFCLPRDRSRRERDVVAMSGENAARSDREEWKEV